MHFDVLHGFDVVQLHVSHPTGNGHSSARFGSSEQFKGLNEMFPTTIEPES
jgi:hypothetical protein